MEPETMEQTGEHQQRFRGPDEMGAVERNGSVREQVEGLAIDFASRVIEIVML